MAKQISLFRCAVEYGGTATKGKAKARRPLSTRKPIHVTLRSSKACGELSLGRKRSAIHRLMQAQADKWGVRIYKASVNGNHIHMAIRGKRLDGIRNFFRTFAGLVARLVTNAKKGKPFGKFWDEVLWTRVAEWGQAFDALKGYVVRNILEAAGAIAYDRRMKTSAVLRL